MNCGDKVIADLDARNLKVITFICEDTNGKIVCISYDTNGLVKHIERPVESISVNEHVGGSAFYPLFDIGKKKYEGKDNMK